MFSKAFIPYGVYWSTPFCKWQGSFQRLHSLMFHGLVAKRELAKRNISPEIFDHVVMGMTTPQQGQFMGAPWFMSEVGAPYIAGPTIGQACATSARCISTAAAEVETGGASTVLTVAFDRNSNSPVLHYPDPQGVNGAPDIEKFILDNLTGDWGRVPFASVGMVVTAENCAKKWNISTAEQHEAVLRRFEQYAQARANDAAFHKRYMTLPFDVPDKSFKKTVGQIDGDEGVYMTSAEKLAKLKPVVEGGTVTFGGQTHVADGGAGMVITTREKAQELSRDPNIEIQILSTGQARTDLLYMPAAPVPAAKRALQAAGLKLEQIDVVNSHNPFIVNDIVFARETGRDVMTMNNYGSSLVFGHPNGPTGMRSTIEAIEELALKGGGYGLFEGCAAGDAAMAVVVKVTDKRKG